MGQRRSRAEAKGGASNPIGWQVSGGPGEPRRYRDPNLRISMVTGVALTPGKKKTL